MGQRFLEGPRVAATDGDAEAVITFTPDAVAGNAQGAEKAPRDAAMRYSAAEEYLALLRQLHKRRNLPELPEIAVDPVEPITPGHDRAGPDREHGFSDDVTATSLRRDIINVGHDFTFIHISRRVSRECRIRVPVNVS